MAFKQKTWTNRVAEYINRRLLTYEDGRTELVTVARSEGKVSVEGDGFDDKNMNDLEQRIADEFTALNNALENTKWKKLWENPDPTASFSAQNIILNSDDYDALIFVVKLSNNSSIILPTNIALKGFDCRLVSSTVSDVCFGGGIRQVTYVSDTELTIGNASTYISNKYTSPNNSNIIPLYIYGIKFSK